MENFRETDKRYYFYEKSKKSLENEIDEYLELKNYGHDSLKFIYLFDEEDLLDEKIDERVENVLKTLLSKIDSSSITISFEHQLKENLDNNKTFLKLNSLCEKYKDINIGIESEYRTWKPSEVLYSNKILDKLAFEINSKNLSNFEKIMYAYMIATNRPYKDTKNDSSVPRTIYGVLTSDEIVCVGYCELFKEIVKRLNLKDVKIFKNNIEATIINESVSKHRNLIVYLKDDKYKIDGYYYFDPTWDAKSKTEDFKFNFFMVNLKEIKNIEEYCIDSEKIKYSGFSEDTDRMNFLSYYSRPEQNDKVSISAHKLNACKDFLDFFVKDKNYSSELEEFKKQGNFENNLKENFSKLLPIIYEKTKNISIKDFYNALKNVLNVYNENIESYLTFHKNSETSTFQNYSNQNSSTQINNNENSFNESNKNLKKEEINKQIEKIINYNIKVSRLCFTERSDALFRKLTNIENKDFEKSF